MITVITELPTPSHFKFLKGIPFYGFISLHFMKCFLVHFCNHPILRKYILTFSLREGILLRITKSHFGLP